MAHHTKGKRNSYWRATESRFTREEHDLLCKEGFFVGYAYAPYSDNNSKYEDLEIMKENQSDFRVVAYSEEFEKYEAWGLTLEQAIAIVHKAVNRTNNDWLKNHADQGEEETESTNDVPF